LSEKGHQVRIHNLRNDFPFPDNLSLRECKEILDHITPGDPILIDSLAAGPLLPVLAPLYDKHPFVALIHLPLSHNLDIPLSQREILAQQEKSVMSLSAGLVVTSKYTGELIADWGIDSHVIHVILPGVEAEEQKNSYPTLPRNLLCVANYLENKGQLLLIKALAEMKMFNWVMNFYGHQDIDKRYVSELLSQIRHHGLANRIFIHGPISGSALTQAYLHSDLFILPSYFETYGMVLTEALAHGIPVIASTGGGIPYTVPPSMGILFKPGDIRELQLIAKAILENTWLYGKLWNEAANYHKQVNTWTQSVEEFEKLLQKLFHTEYTGKEKS
jgi:glycosyltransferase involved in cell wall biosynthesis